MTLSKSEFLTALSKAEPGTRIPYHVGLLMADRIWTYRDKEPEKARAVDEVAKAAWNAAGMVKVDGWWKRNGHASCSLVQRKLSEPLGYEYIAVKI